MREKKQKQVTQVPSRESCQAMRTVVNGCKEKAQWDMKKNKTGNILQIDFLKKL